MPPPGYEPFLKAICDNPDDDTVRLVYADWLEENGDPERAEFIRLQIAYPSRPAEFDAGYARMEELRKLHSGKWRAELPQVNGVTYGQFRRGFLDRVTFRNFQGFVARGDKLLAQIPACEVRLAQIQAGDIGTLLSSPHVSRITLVRINAGIASPVVIERLVTTEWEWGLQELDITAWGPNAINPHPRPMITDREALLLARATVFPRLWSLRLTGTILSSGAYGELAERFGNGFWTGSESPRIRFT
ncbi:Repeat-companion domain protein OS=Isosphaera pallida (strain ATCC 43644 / DSM 9630 / IS1B) GN=Isop_0537 PE=4 SV=1 [Gemmata massiliana]|uniref:Repeat-companion domain protein n=1 Tax=Gemmata massiliana TaxID=1210884 RepID=A0A6P2CTY9_9BACT|nr:TIGR02996 domain-containing protein [Gemmata massiliana]VTR92373.1 Repeat-companion domain protein OS=Isosphaera pallida (strain ATCC 43644 / DSM 9630 / IS1B) GN=Isop_0537 PE=4 SV=1 [Gemmata massiliana]